MVFTGNGLHTSSRHRRAGENGLVCICQKGLVPLNRILWCWLRWCGLQDSSGATCRCWWQWWNTAFMLGSVVNRRDWGLQWWLLQWSIWGWTSRCFTAISRRRQVIGLEMSYMNSTDLLSSVSNQFKCILSLAELLNDLNGPPYRVFSFPLTCFLQRKSFFRTSEPPSAFPGPVHFDFFNDTLPVTC